MRYGVVPGDGLRRLLFYRIDSLNEEVCPCGYLGLRVRSRVFYWGIFLRFSTFQSASGFTAAAFAIVSFGKISSGR